MKKNKNIFNLAIGILISILFLYFAFSRIDFHQMRAAFLSANYFLIIPMIVLLFFSHLLRSMRWYFLLKPIKKIPIGKLFSALLIGYMGNSILPAHLGEFIRAYIIGRSQNIAKSTTLATIVIERIIDMFSLLVLMFFALMLFPFPNWIRQSGYVLFVLTICLFVILVLLKKNNEKMMVVVRKLLNIFPKNAAIRIEEMIHAFLQGIVSMENKIDYVIIAILSISIWGCYWVFLHINFCAFDFIRIYDVNIISSLVLLVITTISVIIPSSPGYVGTYHFLTQVSLELFGVPRAVGLSYAIVAHAISTLPIVAVGLILFWKEGLSFLNIRNLKNQSLK